jgi:hypothetical protein
MMADSCPERVAHALANGLLSQVGWRGLKRQID